MYKMVNRQKKALGWIDTVKTGSRALLGKDLSRAVSNRATGAVTASYAKGGKVKRTGMAKVHKGEVVLTVATAKALKKLLK
jgi:hypothetical protein